MARARCKRFEQLDRQQTPIGEELLMPSPLTVAEVELARLGPAAVEGSGLGLGWTAWACAGAPSHAHRVSEMPDPR